MAFRLRGWLALGSTVGVVVIACGDDTVAQRTPAKLAQGCTLNSECATPLICAFQICHTACNESRDCPPGQRCVAGNGSKNVCLLPDEEECVSDAGCHGDQVCAEDQECRDPCTDEDQCIGDQVCSTSGACADPDEVDDEGNLPMSGSGGTGGGGGKGGTGGDAAMGGESGEASGGRTGGTGGGTSGNGGDAGQGEGAEGGTGGSSGNGGTSGGGGTNGGTAGVGAGTGGTAGGGAGGAGSGGTAGASAGTAGTAGASGAGCIRELFGDYAVRNDGALLYEGNPERRIVDSNTTLPLTGVINVLTGTHHGCAAKTDGSAWCWPLNSSGDTYGQIGDGTPVSSVLYGAVRVRTSDSTYLENVTSIASASYYGLYASCAVSAGTLWCWGDTSDLLNNGVAQQNEFATQVTTNGTTPLANVKEVSISWGHACALIDTGASDEVWCWGDNDSAEAGTGATGRVQYPTKVVGLVDPRAVRVTAETSLVLDGDRVKCWGRNAYEECGVNNTTNPQYTPILVKVQDGTPFDGVVSFDATSSETCALRSDQTIWCWGYYFEQYAAAYPTMTPATGVVSVAIGTTSQARYLTTDGMLHIATGERSPDCGPLE